MTRIITGTSGGRKLGTPPGAGTRPTSDRVREALFSRLEHLDAIEGVAVLDLYAGSGALGLEALSRGAARVVLVESARTAAAVTRRNAADIGRDAVRARTEHAGSMDSATGEKARGGDLAVVVAEPVERYLRGVPATQCGLVFVDPPYDLAEDALAQVLQRLVPWLEPDALVVVERSSRTPEPTWPATGSVDEGSSEAVLGGLERVDERRYGETRLWFARPVESESGDESGIDGPEGIPAAAETEQVSVRPTRTEDWATVRDLRLEALRTDPDAFGSTLAREEAFDQAQWESRCTNPDSYVAFLGARPVGLGGLLPLPESGAAAPETERSVRDIVGMWTAPQVRGRGVGTSLMTALVDTARRQGTPRLRLHVTSGNEAAARLYRRFGFQETGVSHPLPGRPHLHEIEMVTEVGPTQG